MFQNRPKLYDLTIDSSNIQHNLISDIAKTEMTRLITNVPSMAFMVLISVTILSLGKLSRAGGYSYSLWGAGFNIPGYPMCAFLPELCFPDYPGQGKRNSPFVEGGNFSYYRDQSWLKISIR